MAAKRMREGEEDSTNRLTDMPESLQLHILSSLETKHAVETLMLSKAWACSWTCIPVLNFNSYIGFHRLYAFDRFVYNVLSRRASVKLEKLTFKRGGTCKTKILQQVLAYAFSHGVRELDIDIRDGGKCSEWPLWLYAPSDLVTNLKLESTRSDMGCRFLGRLRSGNLFKNVTNLHLKRAIINDLDPFSRFLALNKLKLVHCPVNTTGNVLNVHALQLSELTIWNNSHHSCELTTPKLRYFEYRGANFPQLTTHQDGLPILDTAVLDNGFCRREQEKIMFDDVVMLFNTLCNAKSLTVFSSIVQLLSLFPNELVNRRSPFRDLKFLKLDYSLFFTQQGPCKMSESMKLLPGVKAYLLKNSHHAQCNIIYPVSG